MIHRLFAGLASIACGILAVVTLSGCGEPATEPEPATQTEEAAPPQAGRIDGARLAAADTEPGQWLGHGRTYSEQRHSPLRSINTTNVADLGLTWTFELGSTRGVEATPIVVDGVMYLTGTWSRVYALDARTGDEIWTYDPQVPRDWARHLCCDVVNRGVAVWKGAVFVGTLDGRLVSIDAATGKKNWEVQTTDKTKSYSITGAPRVVKDKVFIGNGGAELGVRGYVSAYDAANGELLWRFFTVPGDPSQPFEHPEMEVARATWTGEWWKYGGGGTAWDSMAYDPKLDLLYVGTGNGSPWTRFARSPGGGDNLYLSSILALRPDTGELVWHYQTTPSDNWDYTAVQHMILAELEIEGRTRQVIMQAPKNGFFYVLDRATGEFISAEAYVGLNWALGVDPKTGRPIETPAGNYDKQARRIFPAPQGGHNWHPMAFNPEAGLVYIPARDLQAWYANDPNFSRLNPGEWNLGMNLDTVIEKTFEELPEPAGMLIAWDPVEQREVWRVANADHWNGGALSTAGRLVFAGTGAGLFSAYDARTGEVKWSVRSQTGIMAGPVTYELDGEQYVTVAAGWGGGTIASGVVEGAIINEYHNEGRVLTFKLGGQLPMPTNVKRDLTVPTPAPVTASAEQLKQGASLYNRYCMACHGFAALSSWVVPDLRYLAPEKHRIFNDIVVRGALSGNGMPSFEGMLTDEQADLVHQYINEQAQALFDAESQPSG